MVKYISVHRCSVSTNKDFFKGTMRDIASLSPILSSMVETAIELGAVPERLNLSNAWSKCKKAIRRTQEAEGTALDMCYSSLPIALKALSQYKERMSSLDISHLPEVFHKVPGIWLTGKPRTKNDKGFPPLRIRDAERQWRGMLPWLLETWELSESAENKEEVRDSLVKDYLTMHHEEFVRQCYIYINDLDVPDLEEEFSEILAPAQSDIMNSLENVSKLDYGVGGKLEKEND